MEVHAANPPPHILGYTIRSRTRIWVSYIVPTCLGLLVYIVQTASDLALSYQHFSQKEPGFGAGTLVLVILPPLITFLLVLASKEQRDCACSQRNKCIALGIGLLKLLLFPFFVIYRFCTRLFWAIEGLFHDEDDVERMKCLAKATETSNIELYLLIQAYAQAAPQIILQLYYMLAQDIFRNYETTAVQAMSLVFSAIDLAAITTSYHRIESQRRVGRHYPWATPQQVDTHRCQLEQNERLCCEAEQKKRESERTIASFPESDKIMENFRARRSLPNSGEATHELHIRGEDEVDNDGLEHLETRALLHSGPKDNATDEEKMQGTRPKLKVRYEDLGDVNTIEVLDSIPETPAPPPPPKTAPPELPVLKTTEDDPPTPDLRRTMSDNDHRRSRRVTRPLSQLETFKDMLLVNAQLYIKENVPHPPKLLMGRVKEEDPEERTILIPQSPKASPLTPKDVVDFYFPRPTKIVNGIQQDDFAGRTVSFFGWIAFITMRMLSLSTFCVFYPKAFFILVGVHYALMLACLALETRCRGSWSRNLFLLLLAYIYIFVLMEFRVCFKSIRWWYGGYLVLTLAENITISSIWYANEEFESWWFGFIWEWIVYSGVLFLATLIVYYWILRPKEVSLIVEDDSPADQENSPEQQDVA
ncbi:uncharacterized protein LOC108093899 [Drosophila ficusphila]|uniref:uncharacterized protein LOC108093899 n=1 Tax=Drosophila ficusphila TaxID=30025 RepID=UPI0007E7EB9C|nr:uncharacterized protein LOC108093899 [Drosophila ficusphila]